MTWEQEMFHAMYETLAKVQPNIRRVVFVFSET